MTLATRFKRLQPFFYNFFGHGLTPGTPYYLRYTLSGATHYVGDSVVANKGGNVHMKGVWENSVDDVTGTPAPTFEVTTGAPPLPITASFTQFFEGWYPYMPPGGVAPYWKEQWTLDFSSSTGPITGVDIVPTYNYGVVGTTSLSYLPSGGGAYQTGDYAATLIIYTLIPGGAGMSSWNTPVTVKLTVSDAAGHSAISSQTVVAPYPPG